MNTMNINDNYAEFFRANRELVLFTEERIHDLAADNFHEHGLHPEKAFETIFDEYEYLPKYDNGTPVIYLHDDWFFSGDQVREMRIFCEDGFEEIVKELRDDWINHGKDPGEKISVLWLVK